jgi:transcriptional regulator with XRE-family HTH domain
MIPTPLSPQTLGASAAMPALPPPDQKRTLHDVRMAQDLTLRELEARSEVDASTISRIENGQLSGKPLTRRLLAEALGVRVEDIAWPDRAQTPSDIATDAATNADADTDADEG